MAEETKKTKSPKSPLVGAQAKPAVLDSTTKLDIDTNKVLLDNIIEAGLRSTLDTSTLDKFTTISNSRDQVYQLIDTMCQDGTVSSIVRTYASEVCRTADNGHIVWCESPDSKVSKFVNYLLNVMDVDKYIFGWAYNLIKYGDVYLRLYRESDYADQIFDKKAISARASLNEDINLSLHQTNDPYSYYVEMIPDPSTMFELTKYGKTYGYIEVPNDTTGLDMNQYVGGTAMLDGATQNFNYRYKTNDVNIYQADDFVHACLEDNLTRFPETVNLFLEDLSKDTQTKNGKKSHKSKTTGNESSNTYAVRRGKSMLYDAYKIWREKALLESAILLSRLTRSGIVRKVAVEVGDMPKEQVGQTLRRVKELFEQKTAYQAGVSMSEYTNPGPVENFIYYATHNGQGAISVEAVGGDFDPKQLTDLDWWNNKFFSAFGIPKQYFGWTDDGAGFNGGTSLSIISSVFAQGVRHVQNTLIQAISDAVSLFLLNRGQKAYLNNFVIKMQFPLTQEEVDYRTHYTDRINAVSNLNGLFSDVEDKARRLTILKSLIAQLQLGDEVTTEIDKEIKAAQQAAKEAEEQEAAENAEGGETVEETATEETTEEEAPELDLAPMPESVETESKTILTEDQDLFEDEDLPSPEEADADRDFTENK